ncbi:MAG: ATP-binding protein, partial [Myxococcota bacterium]
SGTRRVVELLVDEPGPCHVLITSEVPATFNTRTIVRTERLKPWDTEQIHELITTLLGARAVEIPGLLQYVDAVAGGQPRFAIDAVVEAVRQGALAFRDRQWVEGREALGHLGPPDPGDAPLVRGLDEPSTWLGALIAAHGYPMPRERLDGLVHWPPDRVATSLHRLIIAGLVRSEGGLLQVASAPAAMRLIERTSDPARLHMRLAEVLEPVGPSMRLGWHLAKAGDPQAVMRCGSACIALGRRDDPEDAEALSEALWRVVQTWDLATERILALLAARRPEDAATFAASLESGNAERPGLFHPAPQTLLVAWARALVACGRPADALAVIRQAQSVGRHRAESGFRTIELHEVHALALSRLERIDVAAKIAMAATSAIPAPETPPDLEDAWLRTRVIAADCLKRMGDADEAVALLAEIPGSLGAGRQVRGSLEARRGRLLWHQKRYRESAHVFAEAARASAGLSALDRARLANNSALASFKVGDPAAAVTQWERARLIFDRLGAERSRIGVQLNLCVGYLELGRWERARRAGTWSLAHAQQQGEHRYEAMAAGNLGDVHRQLEQFELAEARYHDALGIAETYGFAEEIAENLRRVGQLAQERGDEDALQRCQVAEQRARELEIHAEAGLAAALLAVAYARNGEAEPATEALARSRDELADHGDARELAEWRLCSAMVSQSLGRSDRAVAELARVVLFAEEVGSVQLRARADQVAQQIDGARLTGGPDREGMLLDMAVAVAQEQDLESLLQAIAEAALKLTEANRAFVLQRDGRRVLASAFAADADLSPPSWTIAERAIDENREVIVADLGDRPDLRASTSVMTLDLRSVMCVPLVRASDVLGALYVDSDHAAEQELVELGRYLRALAGYAAIAIANAERVAQHDRQIEDAAALAHDMRNLALVLIGLAEHVTEIETADLETIESMVDVRQVGQQLVQMTEQFLQPSLRKPEVLSLSEIIEQVSSVVRHEAERRHIELVVDAPPGHHVHVDREAVRRALFNIVHNAFKYCGDNGRVALSVSGSVEHVYFTVHDSGPGIPDEIAPYIFDFRRQGRQARQGFGIGLSVASRAVSDAGGTIRAGNHPTGGGLVTIILPRTKLAEV